VFIRARTEYVTVYGFDEGGGFILRNGNSRLVDAPVTFQPGDTVILPRDEPVKA
jgi:hypothetical protein